MAELKLPFPFPKDVRELTANQDFIRQLVADLDSKVEQFTNLKVGALETDSVDTDTLNTDSVDTNTITANTGDVTTINSTTGNVTTVNSTLVDSDVVDADTGNIDTVNAALVDSDDVDATAVTCDTLDSTTIGAVTGNLTTVNATDIDAVTVTCDDVDCDELTVTDTLVTDAGGRVKQPKQPAFLVRADADLEEVAGDDSEYTIIWDTADQNIGSHFNLTTGIFTAPVAGTYYFDTRVICSEIEGGNPGSRIRMTFSGGLVIDDRLFSSGLDEGTGKISGMFPLAENETVYVSVNTIRGADLDEETKDSDVKAGSYFSGTLIN
jgi:hypothetical protein